MLTPSERTVLITEIANRLGRESWSLIDLTLGQFSFPTYDEWSGDSNAYVVEITNTASDEALIELARHLGYQLTPPTSSLRPKFWLPDRFRLFMCHISEHKKLATDLQEALNHYAISAFVAHTDIEPTQEWQNEIELALSTTDALVALLTPGFHTSNWTDQEIGFGLGRSCLVISVKLGEQPYGFIAKLQAVDGKGKPETQLADEIFRSLIDHKQTKQRIAEALLVRFENSDSFDAAKRNISLLEDAHYWDERFSEGARAAVVNNRQIREAYGVSEMVEKLIRLNNI